jgi:hypothetical protein
LVARTKDAAVTAKITVDLPTQRCYRGPEVFHDFAVPCHEVYSAFENS